MGVAIGLSYLVLPLVNAFFATQLSINLLADYRLLLFIVVLVVAVAFLAGSYPGLLLAGFGPVAALKGRLSQQHVGGFNTRRTLIIAQFMISQLLIVGMLVIMDQMRYARGADLGFEKEAIVMIPMGSDSTRVKMNTLKNEIARIAGVENVSLCFAAPVSEENWGNFVKFNNEEVNFRTSIKSADEQYLSSFGLELVAGKNIFPSDTVREFLVNETFLRKLGRAVAAGSHWQNHYGQRRQHGSPHRGGNQRFSRPVVSPGDQSDTHHHLPGGLFGLRRKAQFVASQNYAGRR
jgi:hypothetical protein